MEEEKGFDVVMLGGLLIVKLEKLFEVTGRNGERKIILEINGQSVGLGCGSGGCCMRVVRKLITFKLTEGCIFEI